MEKPKSIPASEIKVSRFQMEIVWRIVRNKKLSVFLGLWDINNVKNVALHK